VSALDPRVAAAVFPPPHGVAVLGLSADPGRPSYQVADLLRRGGYLVVGINPGVDELWGERVYPTLADLDRAIDIVVVFRRSEHVAEHADELLRARPKVIWLQDGVRDDRLAARARAAGILVVQDDCIARRYAAWLAERTD
jgi:predicted CoA-binding protein